MSALVADVPMPDPFICSRSSSSSISCPAFSIARIIEPAVYLLGGDVLPSFTVKSLTAIAEPMLNSGMRLLVALSVSSSFLIIFR